MLDAVTAASSTPSQALALADVGSLQTGNLADVLVFDDELSLHAVLRHGEWLAITRRPQ